MDLFNDAFDPHLNLLPHDGTVNYHGAILGTAQADAYFTELNQTIDWQHDTARINGQIINTARQVAWHASEPFAYTYSGTTKIALPWTDALLELKKIVEKQSHATYNACLLNRYNDGSQGMAWHSDAE
ncbi:MAG: alpha-ketoglutarate-dependent dioxygenase AlkB, partial [Formosimonas sp.]